MEKPALVIMAAGIGRRYGGLKQIDPIGPNGEVIVDYSIYDAIKAGFSKVFFVIDKKYEAVIHQKLGERISGQIAVEYVHQSLKDLPKGFVLPAVREKPWGTGHAVFSCRDKIKGPFAVINADDFYGYHSIKTLYDNLMECEDTSGLHQYAMVGFSIMQTLTDNGQVSRGVCKVNHQGYLTEIKEYTAIEKFDGSARYKEGDRWVLLPKETIVSMNVWGFTPSIFLELEHGFERFLKQNRNGIQKAEYFLPDIVGELVSEGKASVKVLKTNEKWYGVTYKQDKKSVQSAIKKMIADRRYPENLWRNNDEQK